MGLGTPILQEIAEKLDRAEATLVPIEPPSENYPGMEMRDAYQIQWINASRAVRAQRLLLGYKVGLTSLEAQKHFKVFEPDYGHLFDHMVISEEKPIDLSRLIQPKIEGEIAFVLGKDLKGPGISVAEAMRAIDHVTASFEIIDSRIRDWKISALDTIADNGSSALYMLSGKKNKLDNLDLPHLGMALCRNNEVQVTACGAAVMGNPLNAVVFLANQLALHDRGLLAGEVILSGSLGGMIPMKEGEHYSLEIQGLGRVSTYAERRSK